jgi:arsenite methyltransferase
MPDVWAAVADLDASDQRRLAQVLETRGADEQQREMRRAFLAEIAIPVDARVLEVGCGTGVLTRVLARLPNVREVVAVDAAASLLEQARQLTASLSNVSFQVADARSLPFAEATFDIVVFDSTLVHVPGADRALAEAFRVLRRSGRLAAFEGDYATTTVALGDFDPLQQCVDAMMSSSVTDRWLVRELPALLVRQGFQVETFRSHGFVDTTEDGYMMTVVDRGADMLLAAGLVGEDLATAMKSEGRRRAAAGSFFGHIAYASITAVKT